MSNTRVVNNHTKAGNKHYLGVVAYRNTINKKKIAFRSVTALLL